MPDLETAGAEAAAIAPEQTTIDHDNAGFWNELCGSGLARMVGITDASPESLKKFDDAYFGIYPYLARYVTDEALAGKDVLEIGLGYGTLGQFLASQRCTYHGLDIAPNAAEMTRQRLQHIGIDSGDRVRTGSALEIPWADGSFDFVYSIGCLHHTGNTPKAVQEVYRVLRPGGTAVVMLYNRNSYRNIVIRVKAKLAGKSDPNAMDETLRRTYDANEEGDAAPHTDFVSRRDVRRIFGDFEKIRIDVQNFDSLFRGRIARERLLTFPARICGVDLYIVARKGR
ncbi:MAG: class I SAM-dependent methyltransferase [Planctomycetes bacterium]|nr:class I SAM-dependent methyltransferase [Planctomycetota bacterium]